MTTRKFFRGCAFFAALIGAPAMAGEVELSVYGGSQNAAASRVSGTRAGGSGFSSMIHWDGKSFAMPPYYGARATWWQPNDIGWGIEMTHAKVVAPAAERPAGFTRLEFTDGHNIITANAIKRWPLAWGRMTPYTGLGIGFAMPHVDVTEAGNRTYGYQVTGPAAKLLVGVKYSLDDRWALFTEYQAIWSDNDVDLAGGGRMKTEVTMQAVNFGASFSF